MPKPGPQAADHPVERPLKFERFEIQVISENIRAIRESKGLTLRELGGLTGLSFGYLNNLEMENNFPSLPALNTIAEGLGVPVSDIVISRKLDDGSHKE